MAIIGLMRLPKVTGDASVRLGEQSARLRRHYVLAAHNAPLGESANRLHDLRASRAISLPFVFGRRCGSATVRVSFLSW